MHRTTIHTLFFGRIYSLFKSVQRRCNSFAFCLNSSEKDTVFACLFRDSMKSFKSSSWSFFSMEYGSIDSIKLNTSSYLLHTQRNICLFVPLFVSTIFPLKYLRYNSKEGKCALLTDKEGVLVNRLLSFFLKKAHPSPSKWPAKYDFISKGILLCHSGITGVTQSLYLLACDIMALLFLPVFSTILSMLPSGNSFFRISICSSVQKYMRLLFRVKIIKTPKNSNCKQKKSCYSRNSITNCIRFLNGFKKQISLCFSGQKFNLQRKFHNTNLTQIFETKK